VADILLQRVIKDILLPFLSSVKILDLISKQCTAVVTQRKDKELCMTKKIIGLASSYKKIELKNENSNYP